MTEVWQRLLGRRCHSPTMKRHFFFFYPKQNALVPQPRRFAILTLSTVLWESSPKLGPKSPRGQTHLGTCAPGWPTLPRPDVEKGPLAFHPLSLSSPAAAFCPCSCIVSFIRFRFQLQGLSSKFLRHSKILSLQ